MKKEEHVSVIVLLQEANADNVLKDLLLTKRLKNASQLINAKKMEAK